MERPAYKKIPIEEFKKLLGPAASKFTDTEIEQMRDMEDRLADFIFDAWLRERNRPPQ